jgi:hypothetical protein
MQKTLYPVTWFLFSCRLIFQSNVHDSGSVLHTNLSYPYIVIVIDFSQNWLFQIVPKYRNFFYSKMEIECRSFLRNIICAAVILYLSVLFSVHFHRPHSRLGISNVLYLCWLSKCITCTAYKHGLAVRNTSFLIITKVRVIKIAHSWPTSINMRAASSTSFSLPQFVQTWAHACSLQIH